MIRAVFLLSLAVLGCRSRGPESFIARGRGAISGPEAVAVLAVTTAAEAMNYADSTVQAGAGYKYVLIDCRFSVPPKEVRFDDFQLVRDTSAGPGLEVNVGDNRDDNAFFWRVAHPADSAVPFGARLAFKVPSDARQGYLAYWGIYWGPLEFPTPGQ